MSAEPEIPDPDPSSFGMWLLQRLESMPSRAQYGTAKARMWVILRELLSAYEVEPSLAVREEEMRAVLFAVRARQAAEVPEWLRARLRAIEFTEEEIGEFLVLADCVRRVYDTLEIPPSCGHA
ncbi:MAG: hypothetical protein ACHQ9S_23230 [Candidatus Binatia bacterium]